MSSGLFITFEGIDGAGKTSHVAAVQAWWQARGRTVLLTREPGGTPLAEALRALFLHREMDALTEVLMVFAARRDHLVQVIEPALAKGQVVLCDRFTDATFAYQGAGRGFDQQRLALLEQWVHQGRQPDLTIWLRLAPALAAQRRASARAPDRLEREDVDFFGRADAGYAARAAAAPDRFLPVDSALAPAQVWQQIESALDARYGTVASTASTARAARHTG
ncbi:MAG: dTMP kinase [Aquabacterium sp.]